MTGPIKCYRRTRPPRVITKPLIPFSVSYWLLQNVWIKWKANFLNHVFKVIHICISFSHGTDVSLMLYLWKILKPHYINPTCCNMILLASLILPSAKCFQQNADKDKENGGSRSEIMGGEIVSLKDFLISSAKMEWHFPLCGLCSSSSFWQLIFSTLTVCCDHREFKL